MDHRSDYSLFGFLCYDRSKRYDPDIVYKSNNDMHTGIVRSHGKDRRTLRQKLKKETSQKITV